MSVIVFILKIAFIYWFVKLAIEIPGKALSENEHFKRHMERKYGLRDDD